MSEGGGEAMASYGTAGYPPPQPATPSSTVPESKTPGPAPGLPPFSSFSAVELAEGLGARLGPGDGYDPTTGRIMDMHWDYNPDGLHRPDLYPTTMIIPQPQSYRPWESKLDGSNSQDSMSKGSFDYPPSPAGSKLPSFQSQFNFQNDQQQPETVSLTTLTPAAVSPTQSPGLPSFHTLSTVNVAAATAPRGYPTLVPGIQQQFLDDRAGTIHLFQSPQYPPPPPPPHAFAPQNHHHHQSTIIQGNFMGAPHHQSNQATLLTVVKTEPVAIVSAQIPSHVYQNAGGTYIDSVKMEDTLSPRGLQESRKKERRKVRASSMDSSVESDGVGSSSVESSGQVAAVSSTAGFKSPLVQHNVVGMTGGVGVGGGGGGGNGSMMDSDHCENGANGMDKQTKKKRKRCGECIGCQRKDNCGDCAPCRNDKSHQICKMRRCEKLTDKKVRNAPRGITRSCGYGRDDGVDDRGETFLAVSSGLGGNAVVASPTN